MNPGRKESWALERGGSLDLRERREREKQRESSMLGTVQEKHFPKTIGKTTVADYWKLLQAAELKV